MYDVNLIRPDFFATTNLCDFGFQKDGHHGYASRCCTRRFLMQPLPRPGPGLRDGIHLGSLMIHRPRTTFTPTGFDSMQWEQTRKSSTVSVN
jgi:hypothetical protein